MTTLKAGSYLKLLQHPEMDLMDVVDEEAPSLKKKEQHHHYNYPVTLGRRDVNEDEPELHDFVIPEHLIDDRIDYECTHGARFANCFQCSESFHTQPILVPTQPKTAVWAHNGSPDPEDWTWHTLESGPTSYGLVCWDSGVDNELYPGYPGSPQHLAYERDALDIEEELVRAYDVIRPAITSNMSLLVTLAELKDVKSLFSEPISFANKLVQLVGRKRAAKTTVSQILADPDLLKFIARNLAQGHLYTEFGLKQTVRDVSSLFSTFWSLDSTVREILSYTGENTRHYSIPLYEETEQRFENSFQDYNWIIERGWNSALTRKFVVTMKYTTELVDAFGQSISPNDPTLVKLGAAMDKLGLNMNPAILWDLVPFSFVVDYFVGIGDWLERFKRSNLNLTFSVSDSCYSVKTITVTEGTTRRWTSIWDGETRFPDHPLAAREAYIGGVKFSYITKKYDRVRFCPNTRMLSGLDTPDFRLPNIGQLKIMASLLTTNIPIFGR